MNKEFIPYEQALELKELGFLTYKKDNDSGVIYKGDDIPSILYQQAFRWLREKYKLDGFVFNSGDGNYSFNISDNYFLNTTYEEAELACIKKLIEIVKNK
jgi:hypothetical protein